MTELRLGTTATGKVAHLINEKGTIVCGLTRREFISVQDMQDKGLPLCARCRAQWTFGAQVVDKELAGTPHWRDTEDVDNVVNSEFRQLPPWMQLRIGGVLHKREGPDSLVSLCGRLLSRNGRGVWAGQEDLNDRRCGRCLLVEKAHAGEPWGGGEMLVREYKAGEATAENKRLVQEYVALSKEIAVARGEDGETPEQTVARLRRQNHEMGARWGRRVAAMQSELDGLRNIVERGRTWRREHPDFRSGGGWAVFGAHSEAVTSVITAVLLELEAAEAERDAYRERMLSAVRARRSLSDELVRAHASLRDADRQLERAVRTGLTRWENGLESGMDELAERIAAEIRPRRS